MTLVKQDITFSKDSVFCSTNAICACNFSTAFEPIRKGGIFPCVHLRNHRVNSCSFFRYTTESGVSGRKEMFFSLYEDAIPLCHVLHAVHPRKETVNMKTAGTLSLSHGALWAAIVYSEANANPFSSFKVQLVHSLVKNVKSQGSNHIKLDFLLQKDA